MLNLIALTLLAAAKPTAAFQPKNRPYDAQHYRIDMVLKDDGAFENKLTATLKALKPLAQIELDARDLSISAVKVDQASATFSLKPEPQLRRGTLLIKPSKLIAAGKTAVVEVSYSGKASAVHEGLFTVTDSDRPDALPYYFTQLEPMNAQAFYPCNDTPDDKATTEIFAVVDGRYTVLSNGRKEKDEAYSDAGKNLRRVHWKQETPHSPYLVAVAIGVFEPYPVGGDVPSTIWALPGSKDRVFVAVDYARASLNFMTRFLGTPYPWAKHDHVAVPRFYWSGMENTSLILERESKLVLEHKNDIVGRSRIVGLMAHELAHQWFGDFVTLKWWDDTWLNEGFASYLGELAEDDYHDSDLIEVEAQAHILDGYMPDDSGPKAHALAGKGGSTPEEMFDNVSYSKGAKVLNMLDRWVGRDEFKKALKAYLAKYANANATSDDFFNVVMASTKKEKELKPFKESWLKKKGFPVLSPEVSYSGGVATVTLRQQNSHPDEKGPFVFKLPIVLHRGNEPKYEKAETVLVDKPVVTVQIEVPAAPQWVNWNQGGSTLVKINSPSISESAWVDGARSDPDSVWRYQSARVLLGEMANSESKEEVRPSDAAFNAVLDVLAKDPSPYVRAEVLDRLSDTRWKKLPAELGPVVLTLARKPEGLSEDPLGWVMVRRAAQTLLGKINHPEGHKYLLAELGRNDIDINFVAALADGVAKLGTSEALAALQTAIRVQKPRGYAYFRQTAQALGSLENPEAVRAIDALFKENASNNELMRAVFVRVFHNPMVLSSPELAAATQSWVLDEKLAEENLRADLVDMFAQVKTPEAKAMLQAVAEKSASERLKGTASAFLEANFKAPPPAKVPGTKAAKK